MEIVENEKPELIKMPGEIISDHIFIFLLDRSGSMGIEKMKMAKDALK
jgi:Mg-chelatase subunit ChlD